MQPKIDKFIVFERFLNSMPETEKELRENIQEANDLIRNRKIAINSDKEMLTFAKKKLEGLTDPNEKTKIEGHILDLELRNEASQAVLESTEKDLAQYEADLTGSQLEKLAREAVDEQYQDIIKFQNLFHEVINNVEEARKTYLKSIVRIGEIRNIGNWSIERLKKAVLSAKVVSPSYAEFDTSLSDLQVELPEVKAAFYRCVIT